MTKKTFDKLSKLEREIVRRSNKTLERDIAPYVEEKLKKHIKQDVYAKYNPVEYERRRDNGGLLDDSKNGSISHNVYSRRLVVRERAEADPPRLENHKEYTNKDGLAKLLEEGPYDPWGSRNKQWTKGRKFMSNTQKEINNHPGKIINMLKSGIEHDAE